MRTLADLVIDRLGRASVWLDYTSAKMYSELPRIRGRLVDLVDRLEAEEEKQEAYERGLAEGARQRAAAETSQSSQSVAQSGAVGPESSSQIPCV